MSILGSDLAYLAEQVKLVEPHADLIHVDVMDAHFVPVLSFGSVLVAALRARTDLALDGHLMVDAPASLFEDLAEAGMDRVTFHVEAVEDPDPIIRKARGAGMGVGMAVSPDTPTRALFPYLEELDDVIVMSVDPGWAGQSFIPEALPRLQEMRSELDRRGLALDLQIDGGVKRENAQRCMDAGASVLVVSSGIFGASDIEAAARGFAAIAKGSA